MQSITSNQLTLLSTGNNSSIYAFGPPGRSVVLKTVPACSPKQQKHLKNQFSMLQSLHHPHILTALKYREQVAFQRNQQDKQSSSHDILVLEMAQKGTLLQHLMHSKPQIHHKRRLLRQITKAIFHLHSEGIAHRDLKLQNILIFEQQQEEIAKIADFGFASRFQGKENKQYGYRDYKGTKKYMAPEIHQLRKDSSITYDVTKTDIFALGIIFFTTVFNRFPFEYAKDSDKLFKYLKEKNYSLFWLQHKAHILEQKDQDYRMEAFKTLFQKMTSFDPSIRPDISEVLENEWLAK